MFPWIMISPAILSIAADDDLRTVQIGAQGVSGDSIDSNFDMIHAGSDKALSETVLDTAVLFCPADLVIQFSIVQIHCID